MEPAEKTLVYFALALLLFQVLGWSLDYWVFHDAATSLEQDRWDKYRVQAVEVWTGAGVVAILFLMTLFRLSDLRGDKT